MKEYKMLNQFEQQAKPPQITCDKWQANNQTFLKVKEKDGAQGGYKNYEEYVHTVNALHAMDQGDVTMFTHWFEKLGKHYNDTVTVTYSGLPRNPYAHMQPRNGAQSITFLDLAKHYEEKKEPKCTNLLKEKFAPSADALNDMPQNTVSRPGLGLI